MTLESWLLYVSITLLATASPGPAVLLVTSHSLQFGPKWSVATIAGNITGLLILATASVAGLSAVLAYSSAAMNVIKTIGALYLCFLGYRLWRDGFNPPESHKASGKKPTVLRLFLRGLMIALTNPKAITFFMALFPQFLDVNEHLGWQFAALIGFFMLSSASCLLVYALLSHRLHAGYEGSTLSRRISQSFAAAFMAAGGALLLSAVRA